MRQKKRRKEEEGKVMSMLQLSLIAGSGVELSWTGWDGVSVRFGCPGSRSKSSETKLLGPPRTRSPREMLTVGCRPQQRPSRESRAESRGGDSNSLAFFCSGCCFMHSSFLFFIYFCFFVVLVFSPVVIIDKLCSRTCGL